MSSPRIGNMVTIRDRRYRIVGVAWNDSVTLGSKFGGKGTFTLVNDLGERFTAYGRGLSWNSRLTPVVAPDPVPDAVPATSAN